MGAFLLHFVLPPVAAVLLSQDTSMRLNPLQMSADLALVLGVFFSDLILNLTGLTDPKYCLLVPAGILGVQIIALGVKFLNYSIIRPANLIE